MLAGVCLITALIAACAVPDYMMKPVAERLRLLRKGVGLTGFLLLLKCFMGLVSKRPFWEVFLRGDKILIAAMVGACACIVFGFGELAARERSRKQQMKSNPGSGTRETRARRST